MGEIYQSAPWAGELLDGDWVTNCNPAEQPPPWGPESREFLGWTVPRSEEGLAACPAEVGDPAEGAGPP